jgi:hypothetical protein
MLANRSGRANVLPNTRVQLALATVRQRQRDPVAVSMGFYPVPRQQRVAGHKAQYRCRSATDCPLPPHLLKHYPRTGESMSMEAKIPLRVMRRIGYQNQISASRYQRYLPQCCKRKVGIDVAINQQKGLVTQARQCLHTPPAVSKGAASFETVNSTLQRLPSP